VPVAASAQPAADNAAAAAAAEPEGQQSALSTAQGSASDTHQNPADLYGLQQAGQGSGAAPTAAVFPYDGTDPAAAAAAAAALQGEPVFTAAAGTAAGGPSCNSTSSSSSSFKSPRLQQLLALRELFTSRGICMSAMGLAIRDTGPEEGAGGGERGGGGRGGRGWKAVEFLGRGKTGGRLGFSRVGGCQCTESSSATWHKCTRCNASDMRALTVLHAWHASYRNASYSSASSCTAGLYCRCVP
jgi:hypothetical protein